MNPTADVQTFEIVLPEPPPPTKFEREVAAFYRLLPDLLATHRGQYVAIHDGRVVDSGPDRAEVVTRTIDRVKTDIFVGLVTVEPEPACRSGVLRDLSDPMNRLLLKMPHLLKVS